MILKKYMTLKPNFFKNSFWFRVESHVKNNEIFEREQGLDTFYIILVIRLIITVL